MVKFQSLISFLIPLFLAVACGASPDQEGASGEISARAPGEAVRVVATTTIVADIVANVGHDLIDLTVLLPPGTDPHAFQPTPQDVAAVADAHVLFANGLGLEEFLPEMLASGGVEGIVVELSAELTPLETAQEGETEHDHAGVDPHTWTDPNAVMSWTQSIAEALGTVDPDHAPAFQANAEAYRARLRELDAWVREQIDQIPAEDRRIVTDHSNLNYFCARYGLESVGAVIPGYSSMSEPSARELAEMEDAIRELGVKAVFVGNTVNSSVAEAVARDTGTRLVFIYTGSLSEDAGEAASYLAYMRYNVEAIVDALR